MLVHDDRVGPTSRPFREALVHRASFSGSGVRLSSSRVFPVSSGFSIMVPVLAEGCWMTTANLSHTQAVRAGRVSRFCRHYLSVGTQWLEAATAPLAVRGWSTSQASRNGSDSVRPRWGIGGDTTARASGMPTRTARPGSTVLRSYNSAAASFGLLRLFARPAQPVDRSPPPNGVQVMVLTPVAVWHAGLGCRIERSSAPIANRSVARPQGTIRS